MNKNKKSLIEYLKYKDNEILLTTAVIKTVDTKIEIENKNMCTTTKCDGTFLGSLLEIVGLERSLLKDNDISEELFEEFKKRANYFYDEYDKLKEKI